MTDTVNESCLVESLLVHDLCDILAYCGFIVPVENVCLDLFEHVLCLHICTAVTEAFERSYCGSHSRVGVRAGGGDNVRGECGVVAAAVFCVDNERLVEYISFEGRELAVLAQHIEYIFRGGVFRQRVSYHKALMQLEMLVCTVRVNRDKRHFCDDLDRLAENIARGDILGIVVVGIKSKDTLLQRVHYI